MVGFFNKIVAYQELFCVLTLLESLKFYVGDDGTVKNLTCNRLNKQNKNSESAAHFLVHFFAAIALMLTYRIYGNATVASEHSEFKESHDCTAFHCTSFLNFAFGISPRIERSEGPEKKRVFKLERDGRR